MEFFDVLTKSLLVLTPIYWSSFYLGNNSVSSGICGLFIAILSIFHYNIFAMASFINYLVLDTFVRKEPMLLQMYAHHAVACSLTCLGLYINLELKNNMAISKILLKVAASLLQMEFTNPFFHCAKFFHEKGFIMRAIIFTAFLFTKRVL